MQYAVTAAFLLAVVAGSFAAVILDAYGIARRYVYVWADGVYLQARMEANAECMLVLIGATDEGKKELVGFQTGGIADEPGG
jgi:hypothetical protein